MSAQTLAPAAATTTYAHPVPATATTTSSTGAPRSLALKISRLLSANLEDGGTRAALETLDEFVLLEDADAKGEVEEDGQGRRGQLLGAQRRQGQDERGGGRAPSSATRPTRTVSRESTANTTSVLLEGKSAKSRRLRAEIDRRLLEESSRFLEAFREVNDVSGSTEYGMRCLGE